MSTIKLIIGLANPGKKYASTRHNAGAWFIDELIRETHTELRPDTKFQGLYGQVTLGNHTCHLLIPTTYMNLSGQSVQACMNYYKILPGEILVAHDEIDLPPGIIRLKLDGGDGGHNGLKDIIRHLNTKQFYRLRIGVGHPGSSKDVSDYVLDNPSKIDKQKINDAIIQAEQVLPLVMAGDIQKAMNQLHSASIG